MKKEELKIMQEKIRNADAILIGASNGLSISEGYHLFADNNAFRELFGDFRERYGIRSILQGMTWPYATEEEKWAFWSRLITHYVYGYHKTVQMETLRELVGEKPYFIVTSNGEGHFQQCGFESEQIYEIEGNLTRMQCADACHDTLYPVKSVIEKMSGQERGGAVPAELVPHCPGCGGPMQIHYAVSHTFIPDEKGAKRYQAFLKKYHNSRLVILELGIGWRNQLIKAPLMHLTEQEPEATYIIINMGEIYIPENIRGKAFGIDSDLAFALRELVRG